MVMCRTASNSHAAQRSHKKKAIIPSHSRENVILNAVVMAFFIHSGYQGSENHAVIVRHGSLRFLSANRRRFSRPAASLAYR